MTLRARRIFAAGWTGLYLAPGSALLTVELNPGSGERLTLRMKRYANPPTVLCPWQRARNRKLEVER